MGSKHKTPWHPSIRYSSKTPLLHVVDTSWTSIAVPLQTVVAERTSFSVADGAAFSDNQDRKVDSLAELVKFLPRPDRQ